MMDVWLLFNLMYPFFVVLMHTYMDTLRSDDAREFNHHGKTMQVGDDGKAMEKSDSIVKVGVCIHIRSILLRSYVFQGVTSISKACINQ